MDVVARARREIILALLAVQYVFVNLAFYIGTQNIVLIKDVSAPFLSVLILGVWLSTEIYATGTWRLAPSALNVPLVTYLGWMALSLLWTPVLFASIFEIGRFAAYFVAALALVRFVDSWRTFRFFFLVHLATGAAIMLYGATQLAGADLLEVLGYIPGWGGNVFVSTHGNQNFVAAHIIITGSMALGWALHTRSILAAVAAFGLYALDGYGVVESTARGAYIGYALSTLLIIGLCLRNRRHLVLAESPAHRAVLIWGSAAAAIALVGGLLAKPHLVTRPIEIVRTEIVETFRYGLTGAYNYVRFIFWQGSMDMALSRPLGGYGIGTLNKVYPLFRPPWYHRHHVSHNTIYSHNEWVNNFAELGIVGAALLFWLVGTFGWYFVRQVRARWEGRESTLLLGLGGGILAFLCQTTFDVETRWTGNAVTYWHTVGLLFAVARLPLARDVDLAPAPPAPAPRPEPLVRHAAGLVVASAFVVGAVFLYRYSYRAFRADIHLRDNMMVTEAGQPGGDPIASAEAARAGDPYSLTNYYKLAYSYLQAGRWDEALAAYRTLQTFAPHYAQIHLNLGVLFRQRGYIHESLWELRRASTIEDNIRNHENLADIYIQVGDHRRAIPHLRRCLRIISDDDEGKGTYFLYHREAVLASLAEAYLATGRPDLAERSVRAALSLNEAHVPSKIHLARILRRRLRPDEARDLVEGILRANPNEPDALFFLYEEALARGDVGGAFRALRHIALVLPPANPGDVTYGGWAQAIHDIATRALHENVPGIALAEALDMRGWAFALVGRYEQAEAELASAYAATRDPTIAGHLAQIRARRGRT